MLPSGVYNYTNAPDGAKYVDDNWISGWLKLDKIPIYLMGLKQGCSFFPSYTVGGLSLSGGVNKNGTHEKRVDTWFERKLNSSFGLK